MSAARSSYAPRAAGVAADVQVEMTAKTSAWHQGLYECS
jgi:hypothetical protein